MKLATVSQYLLPQHLLSRVIGKIANCRWCWFKNLLINWFCQHYKVTLGEALESDPCKYLNFNEFFTRALRPDSRPITAEVMAIVSPVDGYLSQYGTISSGRLLQAKGVEYRLEQLLTPTLGHYQAEFVDGEFITMYLSPADYHRIHMPYSGILQQMVYVPGRLFSVNPLTTREVSGLYTRNERVIAIFATEKGPMAVVMVGAMLVAGIETVWHGLVAPNSRRSVQSWNYCSKNLQFRRGEEIGRFQFGSTVIVLFPSKKIVWNQDLDLEQKIQMGMSLGKVSH